jgi:hypothetical protein
LFVAVVVQAASPRWCVVGRFRRPEIARTTSVKKIADTIEDLTSDGAKLPAPQNTNPTTATLNQQLRRTDTTHLKPGKRTEEVFLFFREGFGIFLCTLVSRCWLRRGAVN